MNKSNVIEKKNDEGKLLNIHFPFDYNLIVIRINVQRNHSAYIGTINVAHFAGTASRAARTLSRVVFCVDIHAWHLSDSSKLLHVRVTFLSTNCSLRRELCCRNVNISRTVSRGPYRSHF